MVEQLASKGIYASCTCKLLVIQGKSALKAIIGV
jgi:hypothetical protein